MHGNFPQTDASRLDALARTIKLSHVQAQQAAGRALQHAITAGHALNQAKRLLKVDSRARWLPWLGKRVGIPERTAELYMKIAGHAAEVMAKSATVADFGVREAAKMLASTGRVNSRDRTFQDWFTPQTILKLVTEVMGGIDCDPCWHPDCLVRATTTFTKQEDGLAQHWLGRVYLNPPFSDVAKWVAKLQAEVTAGHVTEAIIMTAAGTDAAWFHALRDYPRCFLRGRPRFANATSETPCPIMLFYFGPNVDRFAAVFARVGDIYVRYRAGDLKRPSGNFSSRRNNPPSN
jgi:hypothetical protein